MQERARPEEVSHRGDELERLERLLEERGRAGLERRIPRGDGGQRQDGDAAGMHVSAQFEPGATGDEQVDDCELRSLFGEDNSQVAGSLYNLATDPKSRCLFVGHRPATHIQHWGDQEHVRAVGLHGEVVG